MLNAFRHQRFDTLDLNNKGFAPRVLNAFRHQRFDTWLPTDLIDFLTSAQRLSASEIRHDLKIVITEGSVDSAQRLSASEIRHNKPP